MAHREQELVALCRECGERAEAACLRCGAPLCGDHEPREDSRCIACEQAFSTRHTRLRAAANGELHSSIGKGTVGFVGFTITSAVAVSLAIPPYPLGLAGIFATVAVGLAAAAWWARTPPRVLIAKRRLHRLRRRFLKKRAPKRLVAPLGELNG